MTQFSENATVTVKEVCPVCHGSGAAIYEDHCWTCNSEGYLIEEVGLVDFFIMLSKLQSADFDTSPTPNYDDLSKPHRPGTVKCRRE